MASNPSDSEDKAIEPTFDEEDDYDTDSETEMSNDAVVLCKSLQSAMELDQSKLPLSYAYSSFLPSAPHSRLSIEGLGIIKLPLSEADAKRIVVFASRARFSQVKQTKEVQNTWEIDALRVKFKNPNWDGYVQDLAVKTVCAELGLTKYDTPPRCELSKLLVYETGASFLPHRDTQKGGSFATMTILLPSRYGGGDVHLTHASDTQVVDFSSSSSRKTAVLAWYTEVLHEMKPITSGYRLALSYNIVHTSRDMPLPTVSNADGPGARLRRVLFNWKERCKEPEIPDCVAYLLKNQYSEADFGRGASLLEGEDSQRMALVRAAAEGLDFVILLAKLKYQVTEVDYGYSGCCPCIIVVKSVTLSNWADLDERVVLEDIKSIEIDKACFLPNHALRRVRPDGEKEEQCASDSEDDASDNDGWESKKAFWYNRSAFVLIPSDKVPQLLIRNGATEVVLKQFKESISENAPTDKDRFLAKLLIKNAGRDNTTSTLPTLFDCAYKWKDMELWRDLMDRFGSYVEVQTENGLVRALRVFKFDQIRKTIGKILLTKRQPERLAFIDAIRQVAPESNEKDAIQEWCSGQVMHAVGRPAATAGSTSVGGKRKRS